MAEGFLLTFNLLLDVIGLIIGGVSYQKIITIDS